MVSVDEMYLYLPLSKSKGTTSKFKSLIIGFVLVVCHVFHRVLQVLSWKSWFALCGFVNRRLPVRSPDWQDKYGWGKWNSSASTSHITSTEMPLSKALTPNCSSEECSVANRSDCGRTGQLPVECEHGIPAKQSLTLSILSKRSF